MNAVASLKMSHFETEDPTFKTEGMRVERETSKGVSFELRAPHVSPVMLKGTKQQNPLRTQEQALGPEGAFRYI